MKDVDIKKWLIFKGACVCSIAIVLIVIYIIIFSFPMDGLQSLIKHGNIITYSFGSIVCVSGLPVCIYILFFSLRSLLKKGIEPLKKQTIVGSIWGIFSVAVFCLGYISTYLIPIGLIQSSYIPCHEEHQTKYYVLNPNDCEVMIKKTKEL